MARRSRRSDTVQGCAGIRLSALAACLLFGAPAALAFCPAGPLLPPCCPSPCPVSDRAKLGAFGQEVEEAWQQVRQAHAVAEQAYTLWTTIGPQGPLASALRRLPGSVASVVSATRTALPTALDPGSLKDPRAVADILKTALFDPGSLPAATLADRVQQAETRGRALVGETVNGLAAGLNGYQRLQDVAADGGARVQAAAAATDLRQSLAAHAAARQALVDNLAGMHQLAAAWVAAEAANRGQAGLPSLGTGVPAAADTGQSAATAAEAAEVDQLRSAAGALHDMDEAASALTAAHNAAWAVGLLRSQYAGLQATVDSYTLSTSFQADHAAQAQTLLANGYGDPAAAWATIEQRLRTLDTTEWGDGDRKQQAAAAAAASVLSGLSSQDAAYGAVSGNAQWLAASADGGQSVGSALQGLFAAWLEDDKLVRLWQPLSADAQAAMARLDARIAELGQRYGTGGDGDVAGSQQPLVERFSAARARLATLDPQVFTPSQKRTLDGQVASLQRTVDAVTSDAAAARLVGIEGRP